MICFHQVARYLLDRNIIVSASVTEQALEIAPLSGRNYNCLVRDRRGAIVLKQGVWLEENRRAYQTEQRFLCETAPLFSPELRSQLPQVVFKDELNSALAVRYVPNAMSMMQALQAAPSQARAIGGRLGAFMRRLHSESAALRLPQWTDWLTDDPPWALGLHRPSARHFRLISPGGYHCMKLLQRMPELCAALQRERKRWRAETVIHADIKSDNLLFAPAADGSALRMVVIDWELAQIGDPAWDVAGFLGDILVSWIYSQGASERGSHNPLLPLHPAHRALIDGFMHSYMWTPGLSPPAGLIERALALTGARLVQFSVEFAQQQTETPAQCVEALQLAERIMCVPGWARNLLLPDAPLAESHLQ